MKNAVRLKDMTTGHDCHPPQEISTASTNVFVNSRGVARVGDEVEIHKCSPEAEGHAGWIKIKPGTKVFINGMKPAKIMDVIDGQGDKRCPEDSNFIMTGSSNVFFGE